MLEVKVVLGKRCDRQNVRYSDSHMSNSSTKLCETKKNVFFYKKKKNKSFK